MAHLTKQQYDRRRENAAARSLCNEQIAVENGMTEEQADLICRLCSLRHELHTHMDDLVWGCDNNDILKSILNINCEIAQSGLPYIESVPTSEDDYIDIDNINEMYEWDDVPADEEGRQAWYDDNYSRIYDELEALNGDIEAYLAGIDKKYHTAFCPTGALRIF